MDAMLGHMNAYTVETDGISGLQVIVTAPDGKVHLTSPSLSSWKQAQDWIDEHRRSAKRDAPSSKSP
jgi:hypothetical protein